MHTVEFDGSSPHPWKVTTDDGSEWHTDSELRAVAQLLAFITGRELQDQLSAERSAPEPEPQLPAGAVFA